ncbi:rhodanese-like domain-containing protein [Chitinophaga polysaccharea]|uniref:rhodanese-like domain-containing protein n=1 Tax=Chitinophaga TaxID=79328 RepID=UPI0014554558|nr:MULTISPECIES: rhodanese-like domain-containing protein [Chitinophaga]NLR60302.1 rhodanese-like domain-containing protein [Chitinophaga polysaccharea]NLU95950.1 rhodanese-like domain-containing protein [Chitinophaga sp. Ak27]
MKYFSLLMIGLIACIQGLSAQQKVEPWTPAQLMAPAVLADAITHQKDGNLLILSVGPGAIIKNSIDIGPASDAESLAKLKKVLKTTDKNKEVVIYCGCCPFDKCPNVRPAFKTLTEMGFKQARLLNIEKNVKVNWIDQHYPTQK